MNRRYSSLLILAALLVVAGCGTSSSDPVGITPLNTYEAKIAGAYELSDFSLFEYGSGAFVPSDFEVWGGTMTLGADRYATLAVELCEHAGDPTVTCDREFTWRADAGLLYLDPVDSGEDGVLFEWVLTGMGQLSTETFLPSNLTSYALLLIQDGREAFGWTQAD